MNDIFYAILYSFIMSSSLLIIWHKLLDKKIVFTNKRMYISLAGIMMVSSFGYLFLNKFKIIIVTILFMLFFKYLFRETIQKSILVPIYYEFMLVVSEFISIMGLSMIVGSYVQDFIKQPLGILLVNILVAIISILLVHIKFVRLLFYKILSMIDKIKLTQLVLLFLLLTIFLNIYVMNAYSKVDFEQWVFINFLLVSIFFIIILYYLRTKNKLNKVSDKYSVAIKSLNDYEDMMTRYRIANHENKNLLLTIRAMILNKDKNIPEFIDNIIEDKFADDEKLLFKMAVIPSGGLRATIYSEVIKIKEKNIKYELHIDRKLRTVDLIELDTNTIIDICKIIGVFIDNAIEAVEKLKVKNIGINLYIEKDILNIKISNNYNKNFDISKINNEGYTTKGEGHGYGLSLVENIVKNSDLLYHNMEISKKYFSQIISIKYKKSH